MILAESFYQRDTSLVAEELLGKILCFQKTSRSKITSGRIVEVEAYLGIEDPACHTFKGRISDRAKSMYLDGGYSYIYLIYGIHHCLNVVTRDRHHPEAVLIRALEPVDPPSDLRTDGPGKLCQAFGLDRKQDGLPLFSKDSPLWIEDDGFQVAASDIVRTGRIGVEYAKEAAKWPLRFYLKGNPYVSRLSRKKRRA